MTALGTFVDSFDTVIGEDCTYMNPETGKLLFIFKKGIISSELQQVAKSTFTAVAKKKNDNRGYASGLLDNGKAKKMDKYGVSRGNISRSNIVGFFDKPIIQDKKLFPGKSVCRLTAFNHHNKEQFSKTEPFFQCIDSVYKECAPDHYNRQFAKGSLSHPELLIKDTVFSTVTCNYNWRTACHTDKGDFCDGLSCVTVVGDFEGGVLGFPQYDIGVDLKAGDVLLMDSHVIHCNTDITSGERLSFVCYLRDNMYRCTQKIDDKFYVS
jgi:hypothetical protein